MRQESSPTGRYETSASIGALKDTSRLKKHIALLLVRCVLGCGSPSKPISKSHAGIGWYANSDHLLDLGRIKVLRCLAAITAGNKETHPGIHPAIQKGSNHCTARNSFTGVPVHSEFRFAGLHPLPKGFVPTYSNSPRACS